MELLRLSKSDERCQASFTSVLRFSSELRRVRYSSYKTGESPTATCLVNTVVSQVSAFSYWPVVGIGEGGTGRHSNARVMLNSSVEEYSVDATQSVPLA